MQIYYENVGRKTKKAFEFIIRNMGAWIVIVVVLVLPSQYLTGNSGPHLVILMADDTDKLFIICDIPLEDYERDEQYPLPHFLRRIDDRAHREGFWNRLKKRILKSVPEIEENTRP